MNNKEIKEIHKQAILEYKDYIENKIKCFKKTESCSLYVFLDLKLFEEVKARQDKQTFLLYCVDSEYIQSFLVCKGIGSIWSSNVFIDILVNRIAFLFDNNSKEFKESLREFGCELFRESVINVA